MKVHEEDGQVLVLAVAFLLFAALVIGTILTFANASELSTVRLREQRNSVYAADGATDAAIQAGRVDATVGAYGDPRCHASNPTSPAAPILLTTTSNHSTVASVVCTWSSDPLQPDRKVTFTGFVAGQVAPVVQAQVIYHDGSAAAGAQPQVNVLSWTYCGHGATC